MVFPSLRQALEIRGEDTRVLALWMTAARKFVHWEDFDEMEERTVQAVANQSVNGEITAYELLYSDTTPLQTRKCV